MKLEPKKTVTQLHRSVECNSCDLADDDPHLNHGLVLHAPFLLVLLGRGKLVFWVIRNSLDVLAL